MGLEQAQADIIAATEKLAAMKAQVDKIGGETTSLIDKIADLMENLPGQTTPAFDAAVAALRVQVGVAADAVQAVDDKVDDLPDAPPEGPLGPF